MNSKFRLIIVLVLGAVIVGVTILRLISSKNMDARQAHIKELARIEQQTNLWSSSDYVKFRDIEHTFDASGHGTISSPDFDWLMSRLTAQASPSDNPTIVDTRILGLLGDAKLTTEQKSKVADALLPILKRPDDPHDTNGVVKIYACRVEIGVKDKRSIPILLMLYNDPRPHLHRRITQALSAMGYSTTTLQSS